MNNIKLLRTSAGELIIGSVSQDAISNKYVISKAMVIQTMPTPRGVAVGLMPVNMLIPKFDKVEYSDSDITQEIDSKDIPKDLLNEYMTKITGIVTASMSDIPKSNAINI